MLFVHIILVIISIFGLFGNALTLVVLCQKEMRSSTSVLLIGLSISDICCLLLQIHNSAIILLSHYVAFSLGILFQTCSTYFTVAVSVERFIAVVYPFRAKVNLTVRNGMYAAIGVMALASVLWIPSVYFVVLGSNFASEANEENYLRFSNYTDIYVVWLLPLLHYFIPFVALGVLNMKIYLKIREISLQRSAMTISQKMDISITKMLLMVVVVFGVCYIPVLFMSVMFILAKKNISNIWQQLDHNWFDVPICFNFSVNFIIYCAVGIKFRLQFLKLFHRIFKWTMPNKATKGYVQVGLSQGSNTAFQGNTTENTQILQDK